MFARSEHQSQEMQRQLVVTQATRLRLRQVRGLPTPRVPPPTVVWCVPQLVVAGAPCVCTAHCKLWCWHHAPPLLTLPMGLLCGMCSSLPPPSNRPPHPSCEQKDALSSTVKPVIDDDSDDEGADDLDDMNKVAADASKAARLGRDLDEIRNQRCGHSVRAFRVSPCAPGAPLDLHGCCARAARACAGPPVPLLLRVGCRAAPCVLGSAFAGRSRACKRC
jgi:hypothetical protein